MSHRTNQRPGPCATCKSPVAADVGTLLGPPWRVVCQSCLPFPSLAAIPIRISLTGERINVEPVGRLGNERWGAYKAIIDRHGVRARKAGAVWQNYAPVAVTGDLIKALSDAGFSVEVGDDVRAAVVTAGEVAAVAVEASSDRVAQVDVQLAKHGKALYQFQREGVAWMAARDAAVLADDPGLGKTISTLAAIPDGAPIVVVCPAVAKGVWKREAGNWRPDLKVEVLSGRGKFRWPAPGTVLVLNDEIMPVVETKTPRAPEAADECLTCGAFHADHSSSGRAYRCQFLAKEEDTFTSKPAAFLKDCPAGLVLVHDEAHRGKGGPRTARAMKIRALAKAARESGGRVYLLSGTPLMNRPPDLWNVLQNAGLANEAFGSWFGFARAMGGRQDTIKARGGKPVKIWVWDGTPTSQAAQMLKRVMLRRTRQDALPDLPAKTYKPIDVELDDRELQEQMDLAWDVLKDDLDDVMEGRKSAAFAFDEISALRARIARAKIPALLEAIEEYEDAGEPLVVFSAHRDPIEAIATREGWAAILGGTPAAERTRIEESFQRGELKGVACTIAAAGVAITLTRASNAIFVDRSWTPAENEQAESRIQRIGTVKPVLITELVSTHPLDQHVATLLRGKLQVIGASVDAARVKAGETVANAAQVAASALSSLDGQAERIRAAQLAAAERDATLAALLARLAAEDAVALAREAAESIPLTREQRFERTVERAARKQRELDGESESRGPRTAVEAWAAGGIVYLATQDADFAQEENGVGFSKDCVGIGHALARIVCSKGGLTDRAWEVCVAVCIRFRGQIGAPPAAQGEQAA